MIDQLDKFFSLFYLLLKKEAKPIAKNHHPKKKKKRKWKKFKPKDPGFKRRIIERQA